VTARNHRPASRPQQRRGRGLELEPAARHQRSVGHCRVGHRLGEQRAVLVVGPHPARDEDGARSRSRKAAPCAGRRRPSARALGRVPLAGSVGPDNRRSGARALPRAVVPEGL